MKKRIFVYLLLVIILLASVMGYARLTGIDQENYIDNGTNLGEITYNKGFIEGINEGTNEGRDENLNEEELEGRTLTDSEYLDDEVKEIVDRGYIRIGRKKQDDANLFYGVDEEGEDCGIDAYYMNLIADSLGVGYEIVNYYDTTADLMKGLLDDEIDLVISGLSVSAERAAYIDFSHEYLQADIGIMANKRMMIESGYEDDPIGYMRNVECTVGVPKTSVYSALMENEFPKVTVISLDSREEMINKLCRGELFGYIENDMMFTYFITKYPRTTLYTQSFKFMGMSESISIGVNPSKQHLMRYVNAIIDNNYISKEELDAIMRESFEYN